MVKEIDLRKCVDFADKKYVVQVKLFEKSIPIYEVTIYVYDWILEKWRNFYSEYYSDFNTAVLRHTYITNNISEFIERN